jgi:PTH1 family peptidyl-tRNA hydrolase
MKLVVGLGNPGKKYDNTYHNMGFKTADILAHSLNGEFNKKECAALSCHVLVGGNKAIIAKPQTFMNLSGESVTRFLHKYKIDLCDILIIYDDTDIERGSLRIRPLGSAGTHNGMKNIVELVGSTNFPRLRVGIGEPDNPRADLAAYVLSKISPEYDDVFAEATQKAAAAAAEFIGGKNLESIMQKYN